MARFFRRSVPACPGALRRRTARRLEDRAATLAHECSQCARCRAPQMNCVFARHEPEETKLLALLQLEQKQIFRSVRAASVLCCAGLRTDLRNTFARHGRINAEAFLKQLEKLVSAQETVEFENEARQSVGRWGTRCGKLTVPCKGNGKGGRGR